MNHDATDQMQALSAMSKARDMALAGESEPAFELSALNEAVLRQHYDSQYLYASLAAMLGKYQQAEMAGLRAFELRPNSYDAAMLLCKVYKQTANSDGVLQYARIALENRPDDADAAVHYAVALYQRGEPALAEQTLLDCLQSDPLNLEVVSLLAMVWCNAGRARPARQLMETVYDSEMRSGFFLSRYFEVLNACGDIQAALQCALRHLAVLEEDGANDAQLALAWADLGIAFTESNQVDEAMAAFEQSLLLDPLCKQGLAGKAALHKSLEQYAQALACYQQAIQHYPNDAQIFHHLNTLLREMGYLTEAVRYGEMALSLRPAHAAYRNNLAVSYFAQGQLQAAWPLYEARLVESASFFTMLGLPIWQGEPLLGRRLLVVREQGLGDELLFASMLNDLPSEAKIGLLCNAKLACLMQRTFPDFSVLGQLPNDLEQIRAEYDWVVSIGSLGQFFRKTVGDFDSKDWHLVLDEVQSRQMGQRVRDLPDGLRIGFAWRSTVRGVRRDVHYPDQLALWQPLFDLPGIQWICVQYEAESEELFELRERLGERFHYLDDIDHFNDLDASGCLLQHCDLVLAPCNATAVLAAQLGVPVLRMVYGNDYFMLGTDRYPWLPTVHPMVRAYDESWESLFSKLKLLLSGLLGKHNET